LSGELALIGVGSGGCVGGHEGQHSVSSHEEEGDCASAMEVEDGRVPLGGSSDRSFCVDKAADAGRAGFAGFI
jgi:hypothetical protein